MNKPRDFLSLPVMGRYKVIRNLLRTFKANAIQVRPSFTTLVYGSASYGVGSDTGNMNDIDMFLIIDEPKDIYSFLWEAEGIFMSKMDAYPEHINRILSGAWHVCRMYGQTHGVKLSFRIMHRKMFELVTSADGFCYPLINVSKVGYSRIISDKEWSFVENRYVPIILPHEYIELDGQQLLLVEQSIFSGNGSRLGVCGRKFLISQVVFDETGKTAKCLASLWRMFVGLSLKHHPQISCGQIMSSIIRSERFSEKFWQKLRKRTGRLKADLNAH